MDKFVADSKGARTVARMEDLIASDPDCPSCGTRCRPARNGAWICLRSDGPDPIPLPRFLSQTKLSWKLVSRARAYCSGCPNAAAASSLDFTLPDHAGHVFLTRSLCRVDRGASCTRPR